MASSKSKESGNQAQSMLESTFPALIVMIGPSTGKKSEIARELSAYVQYPLINEHDIIPILQNSILKSTTTTSDLAFKIITQIVSTQLDSKLRIIINTSLSRKDEFIQLVQLVNSKGSSFIAVDCDNAQPFDAYDIGKVQSLNIDTKKDFKVEDFAPKLLGIVESHKKVDLDVAFENMESKEVDLDEAFENKESKGSSTTLSFDEKIRKQWHSHEFSIVSNTNPISKEFLCNYCRDSVSDAIYKCLECDEFILHKECAEFLTHTDKLRKKCSWFLSENISGFYDFLPKQECKVCDEFSEICPNCLFQSHIDSRIFPTILRYEGHEHPLNFVIMPSWVNFIYKCSKCDELGNTVSYKCYNCNFDIHVDCAFLPYADSLAKVMLTPPGLVGDYTFIDKWLIIGRNDLNFLPYQLKGRTAIEKLGTKDFDNVEVLPEWIGSFPSLKYLLIIKCKNMKHLPSATALQGLSQLSELHIYDCPLLKNSCAKESGSEWSKISHIPIIDLDGVYVQDLRLSIL